MNGYYWFFDGFWEEQYGYLMKTDSDGNFLWAKKDTIDWINETESSAFVQTDDGGFLSAVFSLWGGTALIKRDSEGDREWVSNCGDFYIHSMDKTNDGDIILAGRMNGLPAMRKITQNAEINWTQTYSINGDTSATLRSVCSLFDNGFAVSGNIHFDDTGSDVLVIKTNENGDSLWTNTFDGYGQYDGSGCIIENSFNRLLVSGSFGYQMSFMGFVTEMSAQGDTLWMMQFEGSSGIGGAALLEIIGEGYILYNRKITKLNYSQEIEWSEELPNNNSKGCEKIDDGFICARNYDWGEYICLIKTDELGQLTNIYDNNEVIDKISFKCYPNPFITDLTISYSTNGICNNSRIEIFNVKGQKVDSFDLNHQSNHTNSTIKWDGKDKNGKTLATGLYFVVYIKRNELINSKKITLVK
ncbi:MAG: T9SS type A sorting domain-containing protein [Candidatus Cloacimonetes bacterium]|nr:T9SS type A sorting domain-containing protein [Candidatus Cloacimonadota bacterium]